MGDSNAVDGDMAVAFHEDAPDRGDTPSSIDSTPEQDTGAEPSQEAAQPQKRKGGRKPIYATSEERKQRNRQAQAAFRERRTEYIKQLEATIKQNEESLASLQQSHRSAADECLMLRYKNSLLERILLEKGIDVQSELHMKTRSPILGPGFMHSVNVPIVQQPQPPLQRTALHQRHQARRSGGGQHFLPKLVPGQPHLETNYASASPLAHPTPSSHVSSPTQSLTRSPMTMHPASQSSSAAQRQSHYSAMASQYQSSVSGMSNRSGSSQQSYVPPGPGNFGGASASGGSSASTYYPSPFQKHFDQLDQEYDAQHERSMLDEPEPEDQSAASLTRHLQASYQHDVDQKMQSDYYQHALGMQSGQRPMTPQTSFDQPQIMSATSHPIATDTQFDVDPNDPMLDADPFGLSASMHYPTAYSFEPPNHGQK